MRGPGRPPMKLEIGSQVGNLLITDIQKKHRGSIAACTCSCGSVITIPLSKLITTDKRGATGGCGRRECNRRFKNTSGPATRINKGYREICVDRKWKLEHRLVLEQHLGRKLQTMEHVHHINGSRVDNRGENLEIASSSAHSRLHKDIWLELIKLRNDNNRLRSAG